MPTTLTISAAGTQKIPGNGRRKALAFELVSGDAVWGFEDNTSHTGANTGLSMPATGQFVTISEAHLASRPIVLASAAGGQVRYTELT